MSLASTGLQRNLSTVELRRSAVIYRTYRSLATYLVAAPGSDGQLTQTFN